ncbi:MAG: YciI family protein [Geminicoccaceae bacterium]
MFVILLRFSSNKDKIGQLMEGHNAWVKQGLDDGVFLLAGSLQPKAGGAILAHNTSLADLQERVSQDPFVREDVVGSEILEITPSSTDERLSFLVD